MLAQPSMDRAIDDLEEARQDASAELVDIKNSGLGITRVGFNNTTSVLNLTVENSGSTVIRTLDIDLLINGTLMDTSADDGELIYPGGFWELSVRNVTDPRSVRVVGPWGLTDTKSDFGV